MYSSYYQNNKNERPSAVDALTYFPEEIVSTYSENCSEQLCSLEESVLWEKDSNLKLKFWSNKNSFLDLKSIPQEYCSTFKIISSPKDSLINQCRNPQQWDDVAESIWEPEEILDKATPSYNRNVKQRYQKWVKFEDEVKLNDNRHIGVKKSLSIENFSIAENSCYKDMSNWNDGKFTEDATGVIHRNKNISIEF